MASKRITADHILVVIKTCLCQPVRKTCNRLHLIFHICISKLLRLKQAIRVIHTFSLFFNALSIHQTVI